MLYNKLSHETFTSVPLNKIHNMKRRKHFRGKKISVMLFSQSEFRGPVSRRQRSEADPVLFPLWALLGRTWLLSAVILCLCHFRGFSQEPTPVRSEELSSVCQAQAASPWGPFAHSARGPVPVSPLWNQVK